ncbi:MAG: DNA-3-methyladenine glycosylase I [Candidatus Bathyarchaeia archaeon]
MSGRGWRPPSWMYRDGRRPETDDGYFENMTRIVFQSGLDWRMIGRKWPNFRQAFRGFDVEAVAAFGPEDVERLMGDRGIVRNRGKIMATIHNAKEFLRIKDAHGSFRAYLNGLDKTKGWSRALRDIQRRFKWLGPTSVQLFLYTVGEDVGYPETGHRVRRHGARSP